MSVLNISESFKWLCGPLKILPGGIMGDLIFSLYFADYL